MFIWKTDLFKFAHVFKIFMKCRHFRAGINSVVIFKNTESNAMLKNYNFNNFHATI